ncbi:MAG TPA: nitrile hydratase accessory protein [Chloroflexota bacterium]|nr:nitrile hydratase accessory protein [Chloroflexota bacterium]
MSTSIPPSDTSEPVFEDAWQAQAFAMATLLQQQGHISPREWTEALSREIAEAQRRGEPEDYYQHWLTALERVVAQKGLATEAELARRKDEWERAAHATPHGQPIELKRGQ